jgi:hypothetical protein
MAFWVGRGPNVDDRASLPGGDWSLSNKRRYDHHAEIEARAHENAWVRESHHEFTKRVRLEDWAGVMSHHYQAPCLNHHHQCPCGQRRDDDFRAAAPSDAVHVPVKNVAFLVQQAAPAVEHRIPNLAATRAMSASSMERTESGLSISSDTSTYYNDDEDSSRSLLTDLAAARLVRNHISLLRPDSQSERILKSLVNPKHDYLLDDHALASLFSAANELFFVNRLTKRVAWDWSHQSSGQYAEHVVGTTALRRSAKLGGYETLIVLSSPILRDTKYNRRLLISTFLHEMIHSFLFVTCGLKAKKNGGHTRGFEQIANAIDDWLGKEFLRLGDMQADLERFRDPDHSESHSCSGLTEWQHCHREAHYRDEPSRSRSPPSQPDWHWSDREGFRAPPYAPTSAFAAAPHEPASIPLTTNVIRPPPAHEQRNPHYLDRQMDYYQRQPSDSRSHHHQHQHHHHHHQHHHTFY